MAFLVGVGTRPELRALLARGGYCAQAHAEGARLLARVYAYGEAVPCDSDPDAAVRDVFVEIEQWVRANFNRYRLALERLQPDAPNPFGGFDRRKRGDAVLAAVTLLARLSELDAAAQGPSSATAKQAASVLQILACRGLDASERARLNHWVARAKAAPASSGASRRREPRESELLELYQWHKDWSTTARSLTRRRRHLIALGLASPRPGKAEIARSSAKARKGPV